MRRFGWTLRRAAWWRSECSGEKRSAATGGDSAAVAPGAVEGTAVAASPVGTRRTVMFLGTSLTAGLGLDADSAYPQQVQRRIDAARLPFEAVNAGVSGETSAGLLQRLDWVVQHPAAGFVVGRGADYGLRGPSVQARPGP